MSTSIWYKKNILYDGSGGVISNLSDRIMSTAPKDTSDDVLAFLASLLYSTDRDLECLGLEYLKVLNQLLIKAVNEFDSQAYFVISPKEREYLIKNNFPLDVRSDKRQALDLIKGLEEIIKELEARE